MPRAKNEGRLANDASAARARSHSRKSKHDVTQSSLYAHSFMTHKRTAVSVLFSTPPLSRAVAPVVTKERKPPKRNPYVAYIHIFILKKKKRPPPLSYNRIENFPFFHPRHSSIDRKEKKKNRRIMILREVKKVKSKVPKGRYLWKRNKAEKD